MIEYPTYRASPALTLVRKIRANPATSHWLKCALDSALARDPVDVLKDAETLMRVLEKYVAELLPAGVVRREPTAGAVAQLAKAVAVYSEQCAAMADPEHCCHPGVAQAQPYWWQERRDYGRKVLEAAGFDRYGDPA